MNIADRIKTYYWIITTLKTCGHLTLKELNDKWKRHNYLGQSLDRNTFRNHRENIEEIFGIKICYTRSGYCLDDPTAFKSHSYQEMMVRHVQDIEFNTRFKGLGDKLQTDGIPGGAEHLDAIGNALTYNLRLHVEHRKFVDENSKHLTLEPYCIKPKDRRWYLLAKDVETGEMRTYALDRVQSLELTGEHFSPDSSIDPNKFYSNCIGVFADDEKLSDVVIKVTKFQAQYLRTLPLHTSQNEPTPCLFKYKVDVTPDLINKILEMGSNVTVLQPKTLRETIMTEIEKMNSNYKNHNNLKSIV